MEDPLRSASYAAPALVAVLTIQPIWRFAKLIRWRKNAKVDCDAVYEDEDGTATEESMEKYSTKWQFLAIFIASAFGIAASLSLVVVATIYQFHDISRIWLLFWSWILSLVQVFDTLRESRIVTRSDRGVINSISCFLITILAAVIFSDMQPEHRFHGNHEIALPITLLVQIISAISTIVSFSLIDRRPDIFTTKGKIVERQFSSSFWTRYSYNWSSDLLDLAATKLIDLDDLPAMDARIRAADARTAFQSIALKPSVALWLRIFWAYRWQISFQYVFGKLASSLKLSLNLSHPLPSYSEHAFANPIVYRWIMSIASSILDSGPPFAMYQLLRYLEGRTEFTTIDSNAWLCVAALLAATLLETIVDYRVNWLMWSELGIPIRASLTSLIYEKMMKIKDCKEPPKVENEKADDKKDLNGSTKKPSPSESAEAKKEEEKKKADPNQQDIINMFAVDANQVGVFGAVNQFYVMFASKFIVSIVFLWLLVGWQSLAVGMIAMVIAFPFNKIIADRYGSFQKLLMKARDKKTKVISEALQGIRQIKFSGLETEWSNKINAVRDEELVLLWQTKLNNLLMVLCSSIAPVFLTVFALATYAYVYGDLLPSVAFTALGVFMQLEGVLAMVPFLFMMGTNAKISCDRIDAFLRSAEKPQNTYPGDAIAFDKVSVSFPTKTDTLNVIPEDEDAEAQEARNNRFMLRELNLKFPNNALSLVLGPTGSGKSLLLAAILGEVDVLEGNITAPQPPPADQRFDSKATAADWIIPSAIAFVAQTPWIENASIRDNVLFGLPLDEIRYNKVLEACALEQDLGLFDDGDLTEVGAQGISLSGGQKWRLTLARALYSRAGVLILDDVFSALDAHVGKQIYDNALMGELAEGRTRVLATHHVSLCLPRAEYAVCLSATGVLEHAGLVKDLQGNTDFKEILKATEEDLDRHDQASSEEVTTDGQNDNSTAKPDKPPPKKLVEDEKRETGSVKRTVYVAYLKATGGIPFWVIVFMFYVVAQALTLGRSWWIKIWTANHEHTMADLSSYVYEYAAQTQLGSMNTSATINSQDLIDIPTIGNLDPLSALAVPGLLSMFKLEDISGYASAAPIISTQQFTAQEASRGFAQALPIDVQHRSIGFYLVGYILISVITTVFSIIRIYIVYRGSLAASRTVFRDMTYKVLRTPLRWLDTVPTGRILNRFTADFSALDSQLSSNLSSVGSQLLSIAGIMVAAFIVSPYIIILAVILLAICAQIALRYIRGARSIKRLESIQKSPMISHFTASLQGLSTVRAFANTEIFETRMHDLINSFSSATWHNYLFSTWVGFRMAMTGSAFSTMVAAFVVSTSGIDASLGGFALAFALSYRQTVNSTLRLLAATELDMNAAERIFEYSSLDIEDQEGIDVRASWPEKGELDVKDLEVGYADGLPSILKGLTFHVDMDQRIGVVGRTGAGKSTLSLALFRFLQARAGSIVIDGVDISKIKLHDLRTRLAIIPQDPVLFSGTIRSNLDPFDEFSEVQLEQALQRVHLVPSADNTPVPETASQAEVSSAETQSSATSTTAAEPHTANRENANIFLSLTSPISSAGANLSQGQKQLLCLARAILSRPKLLLLDEATSAVDKKTDTLIQRSIREEFANTTLLVIAHRLSTVMDFDRILVMKDGIAAEFGTPKELFAIEDGVFRGMVEQSGEKDELVRNIGGA
ncbi:probable multidrug resistance-associated protein 1 [Rhynchosporium graminicola]|uniref:Probable multidrug resistance-associated protein 1 n=1 Tax=Rhynchosporium graminicola TaxID=2792576 RepID=A0A1E1LDF6_9HELO|nr:probable multidrug resistance-associated protein 1 [Rhynchosporium commune]